MDEHEFPARFEAHRAHLRAVAYRMLGSVSEADDAVQETWLRLTVADTSEVRNLGGWLTTVVARVSLNMLRSRAARREEPLDPAREVDRGDAADPEGEALLGDSVGQAMLVVLDTLSPAERLAFVLHDMFAVPFDEIAPIAGRSPAATRQLASRARRRVQRAAPEPDADPGRQREVVAAFLAAARNGDFDALLSLLDPEAELRADEAAMRVGASSLVRGASPVARTFSGRAQGAQPALVDGAAGAVWTPEGRPHIVFTFTIAHGRIVAIDLLADPASLARLEISVLSG